MTTLAEAISADLDSGGSTRSKVAVNAAAVVMSMHLSRAWVHSSPSLLNSGL